jgi:hypothetical protein
MVGLKKRKTMKKFILSLIFILLVQISAQSQTIEKERQEKRNERFFNQRTFYSPFYPNYYSSNFLWYPSWMYYQNNNYRTTNNSHSNLNWSIGFNIPIEYNTPHVGFGIYMTFGKEIVFISSYDMISFNSYIHYWDITKSQILGWGDVYIDTEKETDVISLGLGKKFKQITPYVSLSILIENNYAIYFDDTYTLSNSGYYTIYDYRDVRFGPSFGTLIDIRKIQFNISMNPLREILSLGIGIKF